MLFENFRITYIVVANYGPYAKSCPVLYCLQATNDFLHFQWLKKKDCFVAHENYMKFRYYYT